MSQQEQLLTPKPMVYGTEWETTAYYRQGDQSPRQLPSVVIREMMGRFRPPELKALGAGSNLYLSNGARLYIDCGDRMEYCTPEVTTISEAVQRDLDGENIALAMRENALASGEFAGANIELYKRTFSSNRTFGRDGRVISNGESNGERGPQSCGYHLNFGLERRSGGGLDIKHSELALLGLHMATSSLYLGSGLAVPSMNGEPARFSLHQRAPFLVEEYGSGTTRNRPVIHNRDEALGGRRSWTRIHAINFDPVLSPWAMRMTRATTSLVLQLSRLAESGWVADCERSERWPLQRIARLTAYDLTHQRTVEMANGKKRMTPLNIQEKILEETSGLKEYVELSKDELWALGQWEEALEDIKADPMRLSNRCDWPVKLQYLRRFMDKNDIPGNDWGHQKVEWADTEFTRLGPGSKSEVLRSKLWAKWLPDSAIGRTEKGMSRPPTDTRAAIRGGFIDKFGTSPQTEPLYVGVDWYHFGGRQFGPLENDTDIIESLKLPEGF